MDATRAIPCRCTRPIQPDDSPPRKAPIAIAANRYPTAPSPPKRVSATSGNRARGIAIAIAMMSTTNDIISTGCVDRNRSPSNTDRRPGARPVSASGGMAGSRSAAYSATVNSTASSA